jgi:hypothetical protein
MARSNKKDVRRPEDWFPPVPFNTATPASVEAAIAAAIDALIPIAESDVTGLIADLLAKVATTRLINTTAPITGGGDLSADRTIAISAASGAAAGSMSAADKTKLDAISGTNTGDQTSIVGITGTKAQFDTAVSDGNILYVGDITQYTDEMARDALGVALVAGANVTITVNDGADTITIASSITGATLADGDYGDIVASSSGTVLTIDTGVVTLAKMANMATSSLIYRRTAGTGAPEVNTLATLKTDLLLTGTNSGDQTSIVGITGTKAQFDTACTDGNFLYVGDVTTFSDEAAQDAVGAMVDGSLTYVDATPLLQRAALTGDVTAAAGSNATTLANANYSATVTATGTPPTNAIGYLGAPQNIQNGSYTTLMTDAGKHLYHTSGSAHTWTIDSNANVAYPIGTILTFLNESGGGIVTLAITSDTLRWGSSTGSRSLAANATATAIKVASTTWRLTGDGIT